MKNTPLTKPFFNRNEEKAVIEVLRSGWHTQGPKVEEFENEIAKYTHSRYAIAVSSCTTALHLALIIAGVGKNDEVLVPSFTFIASVNVIVQAGSTPVFIEIDEKTYNIDPRRLEEKITKKTKAIIIVDQVGLPCDFDSIKKIARKHNLFLIEDAACALGSFYKQKPVGGFSDITCFSFHPRKLISCGEGGIITTNIKRIAEQARILRSHGASISDHLRHSAKKVSIETYTTAGFNYRLTDIQAAIGLEQLKKMSTILSKRNFLAKRYSKELSKIKSIDIPFVPNYATPNWQSYIIKLSKNAKVSQKILMQNLLKRGVATRRGVMACHLEPYYKKRFRNTFLPITERLTRNTISLPIFPQMTNIEQEYVIETLLKYTKF